MKNLKALILCGGKGERLKPLTESIPKPLVPIQGKPILGYILNHLKKHGVRDIVIATGYKSEKIEEYVADPQIRDSFNIELVNSGDVDIIQRIRDSLPKLNSDFLMVYGDTLSNVDISELIDFHKRSGEKVAVTLWRMRSPFGVLEVDESGVVQSYQEKPKLDKWINIGYFLYSEKMKSSFEGYATYESYLKNLVDRKILSGYKHEGIHITVNTQKELSEAEEQLQFLSKENGEGNEF